MRSWVGRGAAPGVVEGLAHVIRTAIDLEKVLPDRILVTRHATPDLFPFLADAQAVVCETGGLFCHLAVLAREMGKPCVTGISGIVTTLETGQGVRVDGTRGVVEARDADRANTAGDVLDAGLPHDRTDMVPILEFGEFSAAHECEQAPFGLETAVRVAALISMARSFAIGPLWKFDIVGNQVLVPAESIDSTVDRLVELMERAVISAPGLRRRFDELSFLPVWATTTVSAGGAELERTLRVYVELNQLAWACIVAKETLTESYRRFLFDRMSGVAGEWLHDQFLDTLILPGHSYILRMCDQGGTEGEDGALAAESRRITALRQLESRLGPHDVGFLRQYLESLDALVDVAERKNTDLVRCSRALFGSESGTRRVADVLGMTDDHEEPRRKVERVLRSLFDEP